ncbi:cellulose synthase operon protein YhjQ/BcsQ [Novosphingobium sp. PP1Y]|uniref:cellulose synthase operon protein YhjQ/BcsQ n=1 Tax=Novosphingobium sp. PP1Y TaxID=702113 RepID=UPI00031E0C0D|nr:cellulose synthase operon protein YhjQ/BcsQ [Novosphingobium sp. PP1Y]
MAVILCHSLKGGTGNTLLAAHIAMGLSEAGADVTVLTTSEFDPLPLHFALPPATQLPSLSASSDQSVVVSGISLRHEPHAVADPDFMTMLADLGFLAPGEDRVLVVDVAAAQLDLARMLLPVAHVHLSTLVPYPECLTLLPDYTDARIGCWGERTAVVLNALDETRRLARHTSAFFRELLGNRLLGKVRRDEAVSESLAMLQTLERYAPASAALSDLRALAASLFPLLDAPIAPISTIPNRSQVA